MSLKFSFFLVFLLCISGLNCGIPPSRPILKMPIAGTFSDVSDTFEFQNADEVNTEEFKGFEIYYKFYQSIDEARLEHNLSSFDDIISKHFYRLSSLADADRIIKPLVTIPNALKNETLHFIIDFSDLASVFIISEPVLPEGDLFVFRGVKDEFNVYKNFSKISLDDADVKDNALRSLETIYLTLYILSYGIFDLSIELYSRPQCLNTISIN